MVYSIYTYICLKCTQFLKINMQAILSVNVTAVVCFLLWNWPNLYKLKFTDVCTMCYTADCYHVYPMTNAAGCVLPLHRVALCAGINRVIYHFDMCTFSTLASTIMNMSTMHEDLCTSVGNKQFPIWLIL